MKGIMLVLLVIFLISCSGSDSSGEIANTVPVQYIPAKSTCRLEKLASFTLDESTYQIGYVSPYVNHVDEQGNIFISDRGNFCILKYDSQGRFLGIVGKRGRGPGEYMRPFAVTTDEYGRIYVFDVSKFATIIYDSSLHYLDEIHYTRGFPTTGEALFRDSIKIISIYERKDNNPYRNVHFLHFLDEHFQLTASIRLDYPPIYKELNLLNKVFIRWAFQKPYIYVNFPALPEIYKYDLQGNLVAAFRIETRNFKQISERIPQKSNVVKLRELYDKYSSSACLYGFGKRYLFYVYYNSLPTKSDEKNQFSFFTKPPREYYYRVLTTTGENIAPENEQLTGEPLYCTEQGKLYILTGDEPDRRKVEVYQVIVDNADTSQAAALAK